MIIWPVVYSSDYDKVQPGHAAVHPKNTEIQLNINWKIFSNKQQPTDYYVMYFVYYILA